MDNNLIQAFQHTGYRLPPGAKPPVSLQKQDINIWIAEVVDVDVERMTMSVKVEFKDTVIPNVPITQPFAGASSFISGMPEKGSLVVLGVNNNFEMVYPIAYLPMYLNAIDHKHIQTWPDTVQSVDNDRFYRHRLLRPGEINLGSGEGSEILLNYDTMLEDAYGDSLILRSSDHSIISTSLSNAMFSSGVWLNAGIIQRNSLGKANSTDDHFAFSHTLRDGRIAYQLKPDDANEYSKYYSEYLIEVEDQGAPYLPINDMNYDTNPEMRRPIAVFSLGNFAGNNFAKPNTYGKLLGVNLFNAHDTTDGSFSFRPLIQDEPEKYGMAIMLYAPSKENYEGKGALLGIDKEGHFYQFIPRASGGGLGRGRSMSILAEGNKKEIWGSEDTSGNAWDLTLHGGLKWVIDGGHNSADINNPSLNSTSIHIETKDRAYFQYGDTQESTIYDIDQPDKVLNDISKYQKIEKVGGYERKEITGVRETIISGGDKYDIQGLKQEKIEGFYDTLVGSNRNISVGDTYSLSVTNEAQEKIGSKKVSTTTGGHDIIVNTIGNITETIQVQGNRTTSITLGDITENISTTGKRSFQTSLGDFSVNILTQGNISHKTNVGSIVMNTQVGKMTTNSSLGLQLKTSAGASLEGLKIDLKTTLPASNVVTANTSACYITGVNHIGQMTVTA